MRILVQFVFLAALVSAGVMSAMAHLPSTSMVPVTKRPSVELSIVCEKIAGDGFVYFRGELRNNLTTLLHVQEPEATTVSIRAFNEKHNVANEEWDGWWSLIPAGTFSGPGVVSLMPSAAIDLPFEYNFEPGTYIVEWSYTSKHAPGVDWVGTAVSNRLRIEIPEPPASEEDALEN